MANENSEFVLAWDLISRGDDLGAAKLVIPGANDGNLEALSILALTQINLGNWQLCDECIQDAGEIGGRNYWLENQTVNHVYSAFIARLDAFEDIASNKFSHFESLMMTEQYLSQRNEPGAVYNAIRSIRSLFAGSEVQKNFDSLASHIFSWVHEIQSRGILDENEISELLEAFAYIATISFDLHESRRLMEIYEKNWNQ